MEYNKESFKKALKECGIIRWENHFEKVVKAYLKAETEQLTIPDVSQRSELLEAYQHFIDWNEEHDRKASASERIEAFIASNCG